LGLLTLVQGTEGRQFAVLGRIVSGAGLAFLLANKRGAGEVQTLGDRRGRRCIPRWSAVLVFVSLQVRTITTFLVILSMSTVMAYG